MKSKLFMFIMALTISTCPPTAQAQNVIPYLPMQNDFGGTAVADLATFEPSLSQFTLEVTADATGTPVSIDMLGITYTPQISTDLRFVLYKEKVYIYEGDEYKETQIPSLQISYSGSNLLQNPGFETVVSLGSVWKDGIYWNAYTDTRTEAWGATSSTSIRNGSSYGTYRMLMHNNARYLTQQLATGEVKPNTYYKVAYHWAEAAGANDGGLYTIELGSTQFASDYLSIPAHTVTNTENAWRDFETTFKTGSNVDINNPVWFTLHRSNSKIDYLDDISLLEGTAAVGITGAVSAQYAAEVVAAPEMTPNYAAGDAFDMYPYYLVNPNFDVDYSGWQKTTNGTIQRGTGIKADGTLLPAGDGKLQVWGITSAGNIYQSLSDLPNGKYKLRAAVYASPVTQDGLYLYANQQQTVITDAVATTNAYIEVENAIVVDGNLEFGLKLTVAPSATAEVDLDKVSLFYYGPDHSAQAEAILAQIASIETLLESPMNTAIKAELTAKKNAAYNAATASPLVPSDLETTATALSSVITTANASAAAYVILDNFLNGVESALDSYNSYSGYATYAAIVLTARTAYTNGTTADADIQTAILALKAAKNNCKYSDGAIHNDPNLLYGWDAQKDGTTTPEEAGWIASQDDLIWGGQLSGANEDKDALYRTNSLDKYAFYAKSRKNNEVITYAYPIYLEAGKTYFFEGKNWRRNGQQAADAAHVTFAVSSTPSSTGTILNSQTILCNKEGYLDYSFSFDVTTTGVYYLVRYAEEPTSSNYQDVSADLSLVEAYTLTDGAATVVGELTPSIITELGVADIISVDLTNTTASNAVILTLKNPNTLVHNAPANVTTNGIKVSNNEFVDTPNLTDLQPFSATGDIAGAISYQRAFTGVANETDGATGGWEVFNVPFKVTSVKATIDGKEYEYLPYTEWKATDDATVEGCGFFWIKKATEGSNAISSSVESLEDMTANEPYLIAFPRISIEGRPQFNVNGETFTFSGENGVEATINLQPAEAGNFSFNQSYLEGTMQNVYLLNAAGDAFVKEAEATIVPFRPFVTFDNPIGAAPSQFLINGNNDVTNIEEVKARLAAAKMIITVAENGVTIYSENEGTVLVYDLNGALVKSIAISNGENFISLPSGAYVIHNKTVIVK